MESGMTWCEAPNAVDNAIVMVADLAERVRRLERSANFLAAFDGDEGDSGEAADLRIANAALRAQMDVLRDQNERFAARIIGLEDDKAALYQKIKGVEAVLAVKVGAI